MTLNLEMDFVQGLEHLNAMHISSLKGIQHITISHLVMITMRKVGMMMNPTMGKM